MDHNEKPYTAHESKMRAFLNKVVKSTNKTSSHHNLCIHNLVGLILNRHEETIQNAADSGHHSAFLFVYALGTTYHNVPIHNYLFPDEQLMETLTSMHVETAFTRIQKFFYPFDVSYKFYQVVDGTKVSIKELDLKPDQIHLFTHNGKIGVDSTVDSDVESPSAKTSYIGCLIVSWEKHLDPPIDDNQ